MGQHEYAADLFLVQENKDVSHFASLVFLCVCARAQCVNAWAVYLGNLTSAHRQKPTALYDILCILC